MASMFIRFKFLLKKCFAWEKNNQKYKLLFVVLNSLKDYGVLEVECKRKSDSEKGFLLGVLDFLNNQQWFYFELY